MQRPEPAAHARNPRPLLAVPKATTTWPHLGPEAEFVEKVRGLFLAPACVQASFSAADEKLALGLHRRGVSMEQITRAILLGCARKYVAMLNAGTRTPITSLQYFADIVEEVSESAIPESYWEPLRCEDGAHGTTVAERPSSETLMPQPVGQPRLPRITNRPTSPECWPT